MSINLKTPSTQAFKLLSALVLTGLLSSSASLTLVKAASAVPKEHESWPGMTHPDDRDRLPRSLERAVLRDLSQTLKIPPRQIRIIESRRQTWPDSCLGLARTDEMCSQVVTEGWQIVASDGRQNWTYRTDSIGRNVRLANPLNPTTELPKSVADAVLRDLAERSQLPVNAFRIIKAEQKIWRDGCLGIPNPLALCSQAQVPGWQVTVVRTRSDRDRWIYHTNESGSAIAFNESASQTGGKAVEIPSLENQTSSVNIAQSVARAVLREASARSRSPISSLRIVEAQQLTWLDGCIDSGSPGSPRPLCPVYPVQGWQVIVQSGQQRWSYLSDRSGSKIAPDEPARRINQPTSFKLPESLARAILQDASQRSGLPLAALGIVEANRNKLPYRPDGCMGGAPPPHGLCDIREISGWRTIVENSYQQRWIYAIDDTGTVIQAEDENGLQNFLPVPLATAVRQAVSRKASVLPKNLNLIQARRGPWPDSCLGLAGTNESCRDGVVEGWRIVLHSGPKTWVIRADTNPEKPNIRIEDPEAAIAHLPRAIANAVLQDMSKGGIPTSSLQIVQAQQVTWPNGCLGLGGTCTQATVKGWRVTVASSHGEYSIYRTGESASQVRLDEQATRAMLPWLPPLPRP